jgi:choline-sulfatase
MDPHDDYFTHEDSPHFGTSARDRYDEEIFYTDKWVGALVDFITAQPWGKDTVVFVSADHGECFGEHGMFRHAHELWEELVHVPLFVLASGLSPRTIDAPRSHVDLVPTFRELLGAAPDPTLRGKSLVAELEGAAAEARDVVVDLPEDQYNERRRALVSGTTKLIAFGRDARFSLFDLAADPKESKDLVKERPELFESMKARYRAASAALREGPGDRRDPRPEAVSAARQTRALTPTVMIFATLGTSQPSTRLRRKSM